MKTFVWVGIISCISHSAMLSGFNLSFFRTRRRRFKIESKKNDTQLFKDASGAAISTYEIASSARKKSILFFSLTILVGVMVVLGLTGCSSRTPKIYKMFPGNLERIRYNIERVGMNALKCIQSWFAATLRTCQLSLGSLACCDGEACLLTGRNAACCESSELVGVK